VIATLLLQTSAAAAPTTVAELGTELCAGGGATVALSADLIDAGGVVTLDAPCTATLDLNGQQLQVNRIVLDAGTTLTIIDSAEGSATPGALVATSTGFGQPAIRTTGATLNIQSGSVTANGGFGAAGIGGTNSGDGGTISISGGTVTATSIVDGNGNRGAAIGGGHSGGSGTITISGGAVSADAVTGNGAAGIGAGRGGPVGAITISGGTVTAKGGDFAAGIGGGGTGGTAGTITISGGTVVAEALAQLGGGAGIGGGSSENGGTITITGGDVTATRKSPIPTWFAIGGGTGAAEGTVTIGPGASRVDAGGTTTITFPSATGTTNATFTSSLSLACSSLQAGALVACEVSGGDAGVDILWRAATDSVFAEAAVNLGAEGSGEFSFTVPAAALGQVVTVELVGWLAPVSLGVAGGPVPTSVPSGEGPVPVGSLVMLALAGGLVLRRTSVVGLRG